MTSEELIQQVVTAVRNYDAKQHAINIKNKRDTRLRNTRLLLQNYNYFKVHAKEAVYSADQLQDIDEIDDYKPHILIQSIKKSSHKTYVVLKHINKMLEIYKTYANMGSDKSKREYRVMVKHFLNGVKMSDIAKTEEVDERTIRRDIVDSVQHFSGFVFGFDSINEMSE
jgi:predicted DNA-binding protein YlxM (UPF0122 family)